MYLEYLDWVKRVYPPSDPKFAAIYNALPDTLVWRNRLGYSEILVENYRHPAIFQLYVGYRLTNMPNGVPIVL